MIRLGAQTITIQNVAYSREDRLGTSTPTISTTDITGCQFYPMRVTEAGEEGVVVQEFRALCPPTAAALAVTEEDRLICDGVTYPVTAVMKKPHPAGGVHHVTILCRREIG